MGSTLIGNLLTLMYTEILDSVVDVAQGSFNFGYVSSLLLSFLGFFIMVGIMSLLPFSIGMHKKSVPSAIVTAVIISCLIQPIIGHDPQLGETIMKLVVATLITFVISMYTILKDINNIDYKDIS